MSKLSKYFDKPASVAADVTVCTGLAVASTIVLQGLLPMIPIVGGLTSVLAPSLGGVLGGVSYVRARQNLLDPTPAFKSGPS